jgi:hypothetical protein
MKESLTPNIYDIIRVCLSQARNIIFYLPRTIVLTEFFEILSDCVGDTMLYIDIQILNSANKIKAILLLFGHNVSEVYSL